MEQSNLVLLMTPSDRKLGHHGPPRVWVGASERAICSSSYGDKKQVPHEVKTYFKAFRLHHINCVVEVCMRESVCEEKKCELMC